MKIIDAGEDTLLTVAVRNNEKTCVIEDILHDNPSLINKRGLMGNTPLCLAARQKNLDHVRFLLKAGGCANLSNNLGNTPLIWAVKEYSSDDIIDELIRYGAEVNAAGHMNKTALVWAISANNVLLTQKLLKYGADPNISDNEVGTPILRAALNDNWDILKVLVEFGAKYHFEKNHLFGQRLLLVSSYFGFDWLAEYLLKNSIDCKIRNQLDVKAPWLDMPSDCDYGLNAIEIALKYGHNNVVQIFNNFWSSGNLN